MFETTELAPVATARESGPGFDPISGGGVPEPAASFVADGFFSAFAEEIHSPREPGPGDSNYELTFTLAGFDGKADTSWEAATDEFEPEAPSSDAIRSAPAAPGLESWHHRFIASWGRWLIITALGLIGVSAAVIAYLFWRTIRLGEAAALLSPTLIAGFVCAVALLMIAVPLLLLAASLTEIARDVRQLCPRSDRRPIADRR